MWRWKVRRWEPKIPRGLVRWWGCPGLQDWSWEEPVGLSRWKVKRWEQEIPKGLELRWGSRTDRMKALMELPVTKAMLKENLMRRSWGCLEALRRARPMADLKAASKAQPRGGQALTLMVNLEDCSSAVQAAGLRAMVMALTEEIQAGWVN